MASGQQAAAPQSPIIRTTKLSSIVSSSATTLVDRFTDILDIVSSGNKDKYVTAAETYQIDVHTSAMVWSQRIEFLFKVRAAEELLAVARKLKQLWILSEAKEESGERKSDAENRLQVDDVAKEVQRILRKEENVGEKHDVQHANNTAGEAIEID